MYNTSNGSQLLLKEIFEPYEADKTKQCWETLCFKEGEFRGTIWFYHADSLTVRSTLSAHQNHF